MEGPLDSPTKDSSLPAAIQTNSTESKEGPPGQGPVLQEGDSATRIEVKDSSGKRFTAIEFPKAKECLMMFKTCPRRRPNWFVVGIVVVSIIAVISVYQISKYTNRPTKIYTEEVDTLITVNHGAENEDPSAKIYKSHSGKAIQYQNDDPAVAVTEESQGVLLPHESTRKQLNQQPLDSLGDGPKKLPNLYLEMEKKRKKIASKVNNRPANETEIAKTLTILSGRFDAERKLFQNKEFRTWMPGDKPTLIMLVTTWRSGSTFLGQALTSHPGVFQHYEPLGYMGMKQIRSGKDASEAHRVLHQLADCDYKRLDKYMAFSKEHAVDVLSHNFRINDACKAGPNKNACFNATFLSGSCKRFPIQLFKTVRLRLNLTQLFLNDEKMNVKVVYLARDPRAIMNSRYASVKWCKGYPDCNDPEHLCSDMQADLKVSAAFEKLYSHRYRILKYEDFFKDPQKEMKSLMDFLGLEYSQAIDKFILDHTKANDNAPWSVKRKSSDRIAIWKQQLPLQEIHEIQNVCEGVLKALGYEITG